MSVELSQHETMTNNFYQLVNALVVSPPLTTTLTTIALILDEQTLQSLPLFVSDSKEPLFRLEQWAWQVLSEDFRRWIDDQSYIKLFHALYSFNIKLVSIKETIESNTKVELLMPSDDALIDSVLNQIKSENDRFLKVVSLWFDVLAYLVHEQSDIVYSPIIIHLNSRLSREFVMTDQYKSYLQQLTKPTVSPTVLTRKLMFYLKTCSLSLNVYFWSKNQDFPFNAKDIVQFLGRDYAQMILVQSEHVNSWSDELLSCIARVTGFICSACWWGGENSENVDMIIPPTDTDYTLLLAFIRIVSHQPIQRYIISQWHHDENILIDTTLILLIGAVQAQHLGCFISSKTIFTSTLLQIAQTAIYGRIRVCAYGFLAIILSDTQLKELKIADDMGRFFFDVLEKAWKHPEKKWKKIPISFLLKGFLSLSTNDSIQNATAHFKKTSLLIELCDEYPIVYDIIWSLSYNPSIQEQLISNRPFMAKLAKFEHEPNESNMAKSVNGILWVLNSTHQKSEVNNQKDDTKFDVMISYSHKEKEISKQLYEELTRAGYRVWIDYDQMHGNVMDAMAQAIEQSHIIILCMSEPYQRSNYCRAEAQYAFKRQLKMIPILVQKYYKPDGWLSFLISQLLYIDFTKHDFPQAMEMLFKELKLNLPQNNISVIPEQSHNSTLNQLVHSSSPPTTRTPLPSQPTVLPEDVRDWTSSNVHQWLVENNLTQMTHLLSDTDGRSLIYLSNYISTGDPEKMLALLQQDSLRRTNETLSLVEISRFRSLIEKEGFAKVKPAKPLEQTNLVTPTTPSTHRSRSCQIM